MLNLQYFENLWITDRLMAEILASPRCQAGLCSQSSELKNLRSVDSVYIKKERNFRYKPFFQNLFKH